jgi:hypothetical protein
MEVEHSLALIENPADEPWLKQKLKWKRSVDEQIVAGIAGCYGRVQIEYGLRLDRVLAAASDLRDVADITLVDELTALTGVAELLKTKVALISEQRRTSSLELVDFVESLICGSPAAPRGKDILTELRR